MAKFAQIDRLDALIVLVRDEQFYFSLEIDPKGGPLDDFFHIFLLDENLQFCLLFFYFFLTSSLLHRIIQHNTIAVFVFKHITITTHPYNQTSNGTALSNSSFKN